MEKSKDDKPSDLIDFDVLAAGELCALTVEDQSISSNSSCASGVSGWDKGGIAGGGVEFFFAFWDAVDERPFKEPIDRNALSRLAGPMFCGRSVGGGGGGLGVD